MINHAFAGSGSFREFTNTAGKKIIAAVDHYDAKTEIVTLRKKSGQRFKLKISLFIGADQIYFKNTDPVSKEKTTTPRKKGDPLNILIKSGPAPSGIKTNSSYEIVFKNNTSEVIASMSFKAFFYYKRKMPMGIGIPSGTSGSITNLQPDQEQAVIISEFLNQLQSEPKEQNGNQMIKQPDGIWIKVFVDGEEIKNWATPAYLPQKFKNKFAALPYKSKSITIKNIL